MTTYIALLRGINVSGKNSIKMVELKQLIIDLGFSEVRTYIQSGNLIFNMKDIDTLKIEQLIMQAIKKQFGYEINVLVLSKKQLNYIYSSNPFIEKNKDIDISKLYVTLLNKQPDLTEVSKIESLIFNTEDTYRIKDKTIYLYVPNGYGKTKLSTTFFEHKLKSPATSRNWKTISKLVQLSN